MSAAIQVVLEAVDRGASEAVARLGSSAQTAGNQADAGGRKAGGGMLAMAKFARVGALAAVAAGAAAVKFGVDAVASASSVEQSMGALEAVYGENAAQVKAWADQAAESVGLSKAQFSDFAATLGASLKNAGIKDYAGQSKQLIGLGADLAAQFGGSTSDAIGALSSLMRGETDPIERYGVAIKQSDVNAKLAADGQDKLTGAARKQAEMQARLALVMGQTKDAQGAFARESDTLAGAQQRLGANFENVKAQVGAGLLPTVANLTGGLSDTLAGSNKLGAGIRRFASYIKDQAEPVIATLREEFKKVKTSLVGAAGGSANLEKAGKILVIVLKGLVSFIAGAAIRYIKAWSAGVRVAAAVVGAISRASADAREKIKAVIDAVRNVPNSGPWQRIANVIGAIGQAAKDAIGWVRDLLGKVGGAASGLAGLGRAAPGSPGSGLARAAGAGLLTGSVAARAFTYNAAPVSVSVNLDYRGLRRLIRSEVVAVAREPRTVLV